MALNRAVDLIVVGLGPAGAALAHRAHNRGWSVLGIDPGDRWPATYGIFADEVPLWLEPIPADGHCQPIVVGQNTHHLGRDYITVDNAGLRKRLFDFPVVSAAAGRITPYTVTAGGTCYRAKLIVDARGVDVEDQPVQQALGVLVDKKTSSEIKDAVWMDLRRLDGVSAPTFHYRIPTTRGMLHEETILVSSRTESWEVMEKALHERLQRDGASIGAGAGPLLGRIERAVIAMDAPDYDGPALAYGARAGFTHPATGYSLATSFRFVDATLSALEPALSGHARRKAPHEKLVFRLDRWLSRMGQKVLLGLDSRQQAEFLETLFRTSRVVQRRFLTLGDPLGTALGMVAIIRRTRLKLALRVITIFCSNAWTYNSLLKTLHGMTYSKQ